MGTHLAVGHRQAPQGLARPAAHAQPPDHPRNLRPMDGAMMASWWHRKQAHGVSSKGPNSRHGAMMVS
jgi:hypothetical protein